MFTVPASENGIQADKFAPASGVILMFQTQATSQPITALVASVMITLYPPEEREEMVEMDAFTMVAYGVTG